ncbi:MAG: hypothetical protein LUC98_08640 [Lachnospiraceae bacterium]|nr:hypothetical protein [Lachnospiraceae bacterium]
MTREEFGTLVKGMKAVYVQATFLPDADAFNVWYGLLQDLPYDLVSMAIQEHMLTEKFPPTIADIRAKVAEITAPEELRMGELEAWGHVSDAINHSMFLADAEMEFNKLPRVCQIAVGNSSTLQSWRNTRDQTAQSHFLRTYRETVERLKRERMLPPGTREQIEAARPKKELPKSDPENCNACIGCMELREVEAESRFDDDERINESLEDLWLIYGHCEYLKEVYRGVYVQCLNKYEYLEEGILEIQSVAESYLEYKRRNHWNVQEFGVFLAEFARHKEEWEGGLYDEKDVHSIARIS